MITSDTSLANASQLAPYMNVSRNFLQRLKLVAKNRDSEQNPSPFVGNQSCAQWVREWMQRNRDFRSTMAYGKKTEAVN